MKRDNRFFFCYSPVLFQFIKFEKEIDYITTAYHIESNKQFWMFDRTEEINQALKEYGELKELARKKVKSF